MLLATVGMIAATAATTTPVHAPITMTTIGNWAMVGLGITVGWVIALVKDKWFTKESQQDKDVVLLENRINEKIENLLKANDKRFEDLSEDLTNHQEVINDIDKRLTKATTNIEWLIKNGQKS